MGEICVTEGDQVKKDQVLFMIDSRSARLDLESAHANLQAAIAQESLLSAQLNEASNMYGWCSGYHCAVHRPWRGNEVRGERPAADTTGVVVRD